MTPRSNTRYRVGQTWSYRTRECEPGSRAHIVHIDQLDDGRSIFHLIVDRLSMASPDGPDGRQKVLSHAPVAVETLDASFMEEQKAESPDLREFDEGYQLWRQAFDQDEAGFFLMPLDEIVQHVEDVLCGIEEGG